MKQYRTLLSGDKFMPKMHLRQLWFTHSDCGPLKKVKKIYKNLIKLEIQYIIIKTN